MNKHTPGPWKLETVETSNGSGSCHKIGPFPTGRDWRPETHACVYADGFRIGIDDNLPIAVELRANANLMAAAPDMYEALASALSALLSQRSDPLLIQRCNAALSKAEGRS